MVKLSFNLAAFSFQRGVSILTDSFNAASAGVNGSVLGAESKLQIHKSSIAAGGAWIGERDDDGTVLWDQEDVLEYDVVVAKEAADALRRAYVLAAYHHWERSVRTWSGHGALRTHDQLVKATQDKRYPISPRLGSVRDLVNTLKHEENRWGDQLLSTWPEVFPTGFSRRATGRTYWADAIALSDAQVLDVFGIVAASGPTSEMVD